MDNKGPNHASKSEVSKISFPTEMRSRMEGWVDFLSRFIQTKFSIEVELPLSQPYLF